MDVIEHSPRQLVMNLTFVDPGYVSQINLDELTIDIKFP
jgi:hypothetical protein